MTDNDTRRIFQHQVGLMNDTPDYDARRISQYQVERTKDKPDSDVRKQFYPHSYRVGGTIGNSFLLPVEDLEEHYSSQKDSDNRQI